MKRSNGASTRGMPIPRPIVILTTSAAALAMLAAPISVTSARLVWNASPSAPTGLYIIDHGNWRAGDRVAVLPSPLLADDLDRRGVLARGRLLIKLVAAGQGDQVCRDSERFSINGVTRGMAQTASRSGEALPTWSGCKTLGASEVLLLGDTDNSYDGRYFGVTQAEEIMGRVHLLVAL